MSKVDEAIALNKVDYSEVLELKKAAKNVGDESGSLIIRIIKEHGLAVEEFNKLRLTSVNDLTDKQVAVMKSIRDAMPKIDSNTMIQKTIPEGDIDSYLNDGWNQIGGYVAKYEDVSHIKNYNDVVESSRLDYVTSIGERPYPENGNTYGYIKFKTNATDEISIPYGKVFGGTNIDGAPCTLNGFTGARNGEIIMIKKGYYCIYNNKEYEWNKDMKGNTLIITEEKTKIDSSFIDEYNSGVFSKIVEDELDSIYVIHTYGWIKNLKVNVDKEQEDYYLIGTKDCTIAQQLGLERCDKYYYEGKIRKDEIQISEEKTVKK